MFRKIIILIGIVLVGYGLCEGYRTFTFIKRAIRIDAAVTGYSSFQKLDRIPGQCSAYRKGCEIELSYALPDGQQITTAIPQPIFSRTKGSELSILVDPADPKNPRIAALHMLFRNGMVSFFLGVVVLFLQWLVSLNRNVSPAGHP